MKRAALGLWMHSGWGVLVAVAGDATAVELMDRRRIVTADPRFPGANQPYHYAARLGPSESERYLANGAAASERLASAAVADLVRKLGLRQHHVVAAASSEHSRLARVDSHRGRRILSPRREESLRRFEDSGHRHL
jgi:hypothetical protein